MNENIKKENFESTIIETGTKRRNNFLLAYFTGVIFVAIITMFIWIFDLNIIISLVIAWIITTIYASFLFFLLDPTTFKEIEKTATHTVEKPIIKEVPVERQVFIDRPVPVERQVFIDRPVPVEKKVFVDRPIIKKIYLPVKKLKLKIPKYEFIGSTETKTYHKRNCRLGKLVKRKYKLSNNSETYFKKKGFKPCKVCITKEKKV